MALLPDLRDKLDAFQSKCRANPHHRYRSWEHCYRFFRTRTREAIAADMDAAALNLGFYLASWGMYRGSSFLLQHTYTVHMPVVERLISSEFADLWTQEVGEHAPQKALVDLLLAVVKTVKHAYRPFSVGPEQSNGDRSATDTLATKVILGTIGCLPACDRYFIDGFRLSGRNYSRVNRQFIEAILGPRG